MRHAWIAVAVGAAVTPLVTWFPMLAAKYPALGLPQYPAAQGIDLYHMQGLFLVLLCMLALFVGATDKWLGVALALAGVMIFWRGARLDPTHSIVFGLGALALTMVRSTPARWARPIMLGMGAMGLFEGLYAVQQKFGYDVLWGPLFGGTIINAQPLGTFGSVNATAGYVAIIAPLLAWWLIPVAAICVWMSHSVGAVAALLVGLSFRFNRGVWRWVAPLAAFPLLLVWQGKVTQGARLAIWGFGLNDALRFDPVMGYGLGGWLHRVPALQMQQKFFPTNEVWLEAHNEPLQWVAETGLVGLFLLGLWLVSHRAMFHHPLFGPSLAALAAQALTWHVFHIVSTALLGILLVGLATPILKEEAPAHA